MRLRDRVQSVPIYSLLSLIQSSDDHEAAVVKTEGAALAGDGGVAAVGAVASSEDSGGRVDVADETGVGVSEGGDAVVDKVGGSDATGEDGTGLGED